MLQEPPRTAVLIGRHMFAYSVLDHSQRVGPSYVEQPYPQGQGQIGYSTGSQVHMLTPAPARQRPGQMGYPSGPQAQRKAHGRRSFFSKLEDELSEL
jgi:hypothetical protein